MPNCNCDFDENNNQVQEEESIEDRLKDKILYGRELIYFTKKVQDEIASASSAAQSSEEIISVIESAKSEILADVRDIVDDSIDGVNSKLDLILEKLDELDNKVLALTPLKISINKEEYAGDITAFNLLDPTNEYSDNISGRAISVESTDDIVAALRAGRTIDFSMGETGVSVLTDTDYSEPANSGVHTGDLNYDIPDGLEVFEIFNNNGNEFFVFRNAVILSSSGVIPSEQNDIIADMNRKLNDFIYGEISFDEYMDYFEPYKHTLIMCRLDGGVKALGSNYIIFTDIPKEDFVEIDLLS